LSLAPKKTKMSKYKLILLPILLLVIFSCQNPKENFPQDSSSVKSPQPETITRELNRKINLKNWEVTIKSIKYAGQKFQGAYETYEAADVWTIVSVDIKNISEKRQREDDTPFSFLFSNLVDANRKKYALKETEYKYSSDLFNKPFLPGESRTVELLFDTPKGIKAEKFRLHTFEAEPIVIQLENK